jgi:hypothetical protein
MFADSAVEAQGKAEKSAAWRTFQKPQDPARLSQ